MSFTQTTTGTENYQTYFRTFQIYKSIEGATPFIELALTLSATAYLLFNRRSADRPKFVMRILHLFNFSNAAIIGCLLWQMMDPVKYTGNSGKAWIQNHPEAMATMCIANFTRVCAYWLFVF